MLRLLQGQSARFNYTGKCEAIKVRPGIYRMEAYGASGGSSVPPSNHSYASGAGLGGYTAGTLVIMNPLDLFLFIGGKGYYGRGNNQYGGPLGGYNGGGMGGNNISGSGGGATDIRLINSSWDNTESLKSRIIVAGGGGGVDNAGGYRNGQDDGSGGCGGGLQAQGCWINGSYNYQYGGSQTSGGYFGKAAPVTVNTDTGGAGGGWYGGKPSNHHNGGGGGGAVILPDILAATLRTFTAIRKVLYFRTVYCRLAEIQETVIL